MTRLPIVLAALMVAACSSRTLDCTQLTCSDGFIFGQHVDVDSGELPSSSLTVCRNQRCATGSFSGTSLELALQFTDPEVSGGVVIDAAGFDLSVRYFADSQSELGDSDQYSFTLTGADGTVLYSHSEIAAYHMDSPNGPSCAPQCLVASDVTPQR